MAMRDRNDDAGVNVDLANISPVLYAASITLQLLAIFLGIKVSFLLWKARNNFPFTGIDKDCIVLICAINSITCGQFVFIFQYSGRRLVPCAAQLGFALVCQLACYSAFFSIILRSRCRYFMDVNVSSNRKLPLALSWYRRWFNTDLRTFALTLFCMAILDTPFISITILVNVDKNFYIQLFNDPQDDERKFLGDDACFNPGLTRMSYNFSHLLYILISLIFMRRVEEGYLIRPFMLRALVVAAVSWPVLFASPQIGAFLARLSKSPEDEWGFDMLTKCIGSFLRSSGVIYQCTYKLLRVSYDWEKSRQRRNKDPATYSMSVNGIRSIEGYLKDPGLFRGLKTFLTSQYHGEALAFLKAVQEYRDCAEKKKRVEQAKIIVLAYFASESETFIGTHYNIDVPALSLLQTHVLAMDGNDYCPPDLFDNEAKDILKALQDPLDQYEMLQLLGRQGASLRSNEYSSVLKAAPKKIIPFGHRK